MAGAHLHAEASPLSEQVPPCGSCSAPQLPATCCAIHACAGSAAIAFPAYEPGQPQLAQVAFETDTASVPLYNVTTVDASAGTVLVHRLDSLTVCAG